MIICGGCSIKDLRELQSQGQLFVAKSQTGTFQSVHIDDLFFDLKT